MYGLCQFNIDKAGATDCFSAWNFRALCTGELLWGSHNRDYEQARRILE